MQFIKRLLCNKDQCFDAGSADGDHVNRVNKVRAGGEQSERKASLAGYKPRPGRDRKMLDEI